MPKNPQKLQTLTGDGQCDSWHQGVSEKLSVPPSYKHVHLLCSLSDSKL